MNRCAAFFLLALTVGVFSNATFGQYEAGWTNPVAPNQDDLVTLFYDTSQGNGALLQEEPPCPPCPFIYIHTGVITSESSSLSDWQFVQNPWPNGNNNSEANSGNVLLPLGGTLHSFDFGGMTLAEFYGIPDGEEIQKLAFVFRNATGTVVGQDSDNGSFYADVSAVPSQPEGGQHTVHFRVNMVNEEVSPSGVHVAGDFQGWDPAATELTDPDGDMIYETTQLIDTSFSEITFKFINGNAWTDLAELIPPEECGDGTGHRVLVLDSPEILLSADEEGNPYCFNSCEECVLPLIVDFEVDATQLAEVSPDGIFVAGTFTGWSQTAMNDSDGDGVYTLGLAVTPGQNQWKFLNGNDGWETVPSECGVDDGFGGFNRGATFDDANNAYACCFKGCPGDTCVPELDTAPITFRINLNSDEIPEGSVPWIWGTFTGWQGGALEMTDEDFDGIWEVTQEVSGDAFFKYKYSLGAPVGMSGADYILEPGLWVVCTDSTMMETLTLETEMCGITDYFGGYDRIHVRSGEPEILDIVCWNRCGDCEPSNSSNGGEEGGPCILDADNNGVCDDQEIYGCSYPLAENFSSSVTRDDGSCIFPCEGVVNTNVFDWDGDYVVTVTDFLMMLSVYGDTDVDLDGVWDSGDDCVDTNACNYANNPSEPCAYIDILGVCGGGCEADEDNDGICDDIDNCIGIEDECGVCNGPGPTEIVIEDITILYDSVYLPQLEEWYVYEFGADTTFSYTCAPTFSACGDPVSYQGYDYATVLIGEQCWFAETSGYNHILMERP